MSWSQSSSLPKAHLPPPLATHTQDGDDAGDDQRALLLWEHYAGAPEPATGGDAAEPMEGVCDRVRFTLSLWPYMVPLCLVYFSEYTMQV